MLTSGVSNWTNVVTRTRVEWLQEILCVYHLRLLGGEKEVASQRASPWHHIYPDESKPEQPCMDELRLSFHVLQAAHSFTVLCGYNAPLFDITHDDTTRCVRAVAPTPSQLLTHPRFAPLRSPSLPFAPLRSPPPLRSAT
jgi:hypothetical protein